MVLSTLQLPCANAGMAPASGSSVKDKTAVRINRILNLSCASPRHRGYIATAYWVKAGLSPIRQLARTCKPSDPQWEDSHGNQKGNQEEIRKRKEIERPKEQREEIKRQR